MTDGTNRPSGDKGEVFDLVERKGPITFDDLMKQIGAYSRDKVITHLEELESEGYVTEEEVELEWGGDSYTQLMWSVDTGGGDGGD